MNRPFFALTIAAFAIAPAFAQAATPPPGNAMLTQAKATLAQLQAGKLDRSTLAPSTSRALSDQQLSQVESMVGGLGPPVSFTPQQTVSQGGNSYAIYTVTFQNGTRLNYVFSVDASGQVTGFRFTSP